VRVETTPMFPRAKRDVDRTPEWGSLPGFPPSPHLRLRAWPGRGLRELSDLVVCFGLLIKHVLSLVGGAS
jgi:hypothetical protein